jgi:hypothetical protein
VGASRLPLLVSHNYEGLGTWLNFERSNSESEVALNYPTPILEDVVWYKVRGIKSGMASRQLGSLAKSVATGAVVGLRRPLCRRCLRLLYGESGRRKYSRIYTTPVAWNKDSCSRWERHARRGMATIAQSSFETKGLSANWLISAVNSSKQSIGPMEEYDRRVREGILREDEHQKSTASITIHFIV